VLNIFRQKTAPAFEVALRLGAIYAGRHEPVSEALGAYSEALGIAYQIRDDIEDFTAGKLDETEPNLLVALQHEKAKDPETRARVLLESYKQEAIRSLRDVPSANLKGLLRRVVGRIFNHAEIKGWCHEFQARNAASRATSAGAAG
jgi:geranylgeranyl pyrophosphate synthase